MDTTLSDPRAPLRRAAKRATMHRNTFVDAKMKQAKKITSAVEPPLDIFDDGEAFLALACEAMTEAAKSARAENDHLGLATPYGGADGKVHFTQPQKVPEPS